MYPNIGAKPIDISLFPRLCGVADAIYNPLRSELISDAAERGIPCSGGLICWRLRRYTPARSSSARMLTNPLIGKAYLGTKLQKQNIVLIGMPSSGKSTVGGLLAESEGREFIDTDLLIAERAGKSIPEIFAAEGESGFRKLESEVIADVAAKSGCVIATGRRLGAEPRKRPQIKAKRCARISRQAPRAALRHGGQTPIPKQRSNGSPL